MLKYRYLADQACDLIAGGVTHAMRDRFPVRVILDPYNPEGSTRHVNFVTSRRDRWPADPGKCHLNWIIYDQGWEAEFCRSVERHPKVLRYTKNHGLDFSVPYESMGRQREYRPDFIVHLDDGRGPGDPLKAVVEIKGQRDQSDLDKTRAMRELWVPGLWSLGGHGRWAFAEIDRPWEMMGDLAAQTGEAVAAMVEKTVAGAAGMETRQSKGAE